MNRNDYPHLNGYYRKRENRYDVAAYEDANAPAPDDMWTDAFAAIIIGDVQFMEAHNIAAGHKSEARAAYWRGMLERGEAMVWWMVALATLIVAMV